MLHKLGLIFIGNRSFDSSGLFPKCFSQCGKSTYIYVVLQVYSIFVIVAERYSEDKLCEYSEYKNSVIKFPTAN